LAPSGVNKVSVVGAGTMGHGIGEVVAISGFDVTLTDVEARFLDSARSKIEWSLKKLSEKGQLKEDVDKILQRLHYELDFPRAVQDADLVIEAVPEKLELKAEIFRKLDSHSKPYSILATNTSSLPISEISLSVSDPSRVIGIHFFNPPAIMQLVELILGRGTSQRTTEVALSFVKSLNKRPVLVKKDVPGFIVNRILVRMMTTARLFVERGLATIEEVDASLKFQAGLPMGAFELADYIGLDVVYSVERALGERGFAVAPGGILEGKVRAGELGMKTGRGYYSYTAERRRAEIRPEAGKSIQAHMLLAPAVNEAAWMLSNEVASRDDTDLSVVLGLGFPKGLLAMADSWGIDRVVEDIGELRKRLGETWLEPDTVLVSMLDQGRLGQKVGHGFYDYRDLPESAGTKR
jgi:3-hydroxyacyl-CoA dehydrogenase